MKKLLLIAMLVVSSSLSFAERGDHGDQGGDFYMLYNSAYQASETPAMNKELGIEGKEPEAIKAILNESWYNLKVLESDKLKEVFAVDMLLNEGAGNKEKIKTHLDKIQDIDVKMYSVYNTMETKLGKIMDVDKLK